MDHVYCIFCIVLYLAMEPLFSNLSSLISAFIPAYLVISFSITHTDHPHLLADMNECRALGPLWKQKQERLEAKHPFLTALILTDRAVPSRSALPV